MVFAQPEEQKCPPKPVAKHHVAKKAGTKKAAPAVVKSDELKDLKDSIGTLQNEVKQLQEQNAALAGQLKQNQQKAEDAQAVAAKTEQKVEDQKPVVSQLQNDVASVKTSVAATTADVAKNNKRVDELEEPSALHYKGIKLIPGGYVQVASIYRTHNANSDTADKYGAFPLEGNIAAKSNEFRMSGRASRLSLRAEGAAKNIKVLGYFEADFLGLGADSNETQTNSYAPRMRLAFGEVKLPGGWSFAGGQNWSLLQTTKSGINALSEWLPSLIDNSYTVGFSYAREGTFRVTKEVVPGKLWAAVSVENPETVNNTVCMNRTSGAACTPAVNVSLGTAINSLNATPSNDVAPDVVAKVAIEPGWGHYEIKGITRFFRARSYTSGASVVSSGSSHITEGAGIGVGAILPVIKKKLDVEFQALAGKGIGRYGTTGGPDVTENFRGDLVPVKALQAVLGIEAHPTPKLDVNFYLGDEYYGRQTYTQTFTTASNLVGATGTYTIGYGAPNWLDGSCAAESYSATTCMSASQNRNTWAAQPSVFYRLYKGKVGTVQFGGSYAYVYRNTWDGVTTISNTTAVHPKAIENIVMTAFRYTLP
ncbi:MAG: hypothetical protein P4M01_04165 [Acidobacteriota bacterium]|nr:hypothetical protein [Acidobacteriota bacterium]